MWCWKTTKSEEIIDSIGFLLLKCSFSFTLHFIELNFLHTRSKMQKLPNKKWRRSKKPANISMRWWCWPVQEEMFFIKDVSRIVCTLIIFNLIKLASIFFSVLNRLVEDSLAWDVLLTQISAYKILCVC